MLAIDFPGRDKLIHSIDAAVRQDGEDAIADALRDALCRMIRDPEVRLPDVVYCAEADHYARRELHQSPDLGYSVVAMTWGPGQGTPVHDHDGLWCVEGVWHGQLEITQYEYLGEEGGPGGTPCCRLRPVGSINAGLGSAGSLIPPHEYHAIRNPSDDGVAVSLHIYKRPIRQCSVFEPLGEQRYRRGERRLSTDA